jgi:hypothetical protein
MFGALGFAGTLMRWGENFFGLFIKYPKELIILLMTCYIIFCQITHNGPLTRGGECYQAINGDTLSDIITETVIFDSSKVKLNVPEPTPILETPGPKRTWTRPVLAVDSTSDCRDSIAGLVSSLGWYDFSLDECEERLQKLSMVRVYKDSARNDSMVVGYEFKARGELIGTPELWYKRTAPYVSTTRTITKVEVQGQYRKIGIGLEVGYINKGNKANPGGLETAFQASYIDKKNHQFILKGGYIFQQQEGWIVGVGYIKNFNIKL